MRNILTHRLLLIPALFLSVLPQIASAQCAPLPNGAPMYPNPISAMLGVCTIPELLLVIVDMVFLIGVPLVVIFIIYSGFLFLRAGDNEGELERAKKTLFWTLLGAFILLGAKAIAMAIEGTLVTLGT